MKIPQLSVFLENRSHRLLEPLQALATAGIVALKAAGVEPVKADALY